MDNSNVLLLALKPADDGLEAGLVGRVWNLSNENGSFALSYNEGGLAGALSITHIETPIGISNLYGGSLVDFINQQQIKTYSIFPAQLPYLPNTSNLEPVSVTPPAVQPTAVPTLDVGGSTPTMDTVKATAVPTHLSVEESAPSGKGCAVGLLYLLGLMKD